MPDLSKNQEQIDSILQSLKASAGPRGFTYAGRISPTNITEAMKQPAQGDTEEYSTLPMIGAGISQFQTLLDKMFQEHLANSAKLGTKALSQAEFTQQIFNELAKAGKFSKVAAQELPIGSPLSARGVTRSLGDQAIDRIEKEYSGKGIPFNYMRK